MLNKEGLRDTTPIGTNTIQTPNISQTTNETIKKVNEIIDPVVTSVSFNQEIKASHIFTGGGGYYETEEKRIWSQNYQRKNFEESGFMSYCGKEGKSASGFSLATGKFLENSWRNNNGMPGFVAGNGRPLSSGDYNFGDSDSFAVGEVILSNGTRTPIYIIGKNGEGVLNEEQAQDFLYLLR